MYVGGRRVVLDAELLFKELTVEVAPLYVGLAGGERSRRNNLQTTIAHSGLQKPVTKHDKPEQQAETREED